MPSIGQSEYFASWEPIALLTVREAASGSVDCGWSTAVGRGVDSNAGNRRSPIRDGSSVWPLCGGKTRFVFCYYVNPAAAAFLPATAGEVFASRDVLAESESLVLLAVHRLGLDGLLHQLAQ